MNKNSIAKKAAVAERLRAMGLHVSESFMATVPPTMKDGKPIPGSQYWTKQNHNSKRVTKLVNKAKLIAAGNTFNPKEPQPIKRLKGGYEVKMMNRYQRRQDDIRRAKKDLRKHGVKGTLVAGEEVKLAA